MVKTYTQIPHQPPATPLLDTVESPASLRQLADEQLQPLADELRGWLLYALGQSGGHFGAGLGVVELTVALHYVYNTPDDKLVWDVGHQCYPHKILTGRREQLLTIRQAGGLSGFPSRDESSFDAFGVGHSSTSIGAALGMSLASRLTQRPDKAVAIIGDGAMSAGMAYEALNHAAQTQADLLVILNDNTMSIGRSEGGLTDYLAELRKAAGQDQSTRIPTLFEQLGLAYTGLVDGHDMPALLQSLRQLKDRRGPQLLHLQTVKGKGFAPAEADPVGYHAISKIAPLNAVPSATAASPKYQAVFGQWLCDAAVAHPELVAITPAMTQGSGMTAFAKRFPKRFYDVAICEQHALTLAAGLACGGLKPVVGIYSTFLQRAYDQLIHDIVLQRLDVTFGIDRAGIVGGDGATHGGLFDLGFMRSLPHLLIAAPADENECRQLLQSCFLHAGPAAVRYPRGQGPGVAITPMLETLTIGKARIISDKPASRVAILSFGALLDNARQAATALDATLVDMRWVKPLDTDLIDQLATQYDLLVTLEDHQTATGAGTAVSEHLHQAAAPCDLLLLGIDDCFILHGNRDQLLSDQGLDATGIETAIRQRLES